MYARLNSKGAATTAAFLCLGITTGFLALNTGCSAAKSSEYTDPNPAISAFTNLGKGAAFDLKGTLNPCNIAAGGSVWLRANFAVKDGSAVVNPGNIPVQSNIPFQVSNILATTTYTLTVTSGSGKQTTATTLVTVQNSPANLTYTQEDGTYYVGVRMAPNTPTVAGDAPMSYTYAPVVADTKLPAGLVFDPTTGAFSGTPEVVQAQTAFTVTATNNVASTTRVVKFTVAATPLTLSVSPTDIAASQVAILNWDASTVAGLFSSVTITANPADTSLTGPFTTKGTKNVTPMVTTAYTLAATPAAGGPAVTRSVSVTVGTAPVAITSLTAAPSLVAMNDSTTLSWTSTGIPLVLTLDGVNVLGSSSKVVFPVRRQTFTLAGSNLLGGNTAKITVPAQGFDILAGVPSSQGAFDGKGVNIRFGSPAALASDAAGNVYWVDTYGSTVRMMTPDGQAKTIAGSPGLAGSTDTTLKTPRGLVVTPDGSTIYVGDAGNFVIKKIVKGATGYTMTRFSGITGTVGHADGTADVCTFGSPSGVTLDPSGQYLLVADYASNSIRQVSLADGSTLTYAGSPSGAAGKADQPSGLLSAATFSKVNAIAFNKAGNAFYVSDGGNFNIRKVTWSGPATSGATTGSTYTVAGTGLSGLAEGTPGSLTAAYSMAVDASENVYITDYTNGTIRKLVLAGNVGTLSTLAGTAPQTLSKDGVGAAAAFNKPQGILLVNNGTTLLVSDIGGSGCIRSIDLATATVTTPYGMYKNAGFVDGTGTAATFNAPLGVGTDAQNNVYVADTKNHLIRKITPAGVTTTIAGIAGVSGAVNATGTAASFNLPIGVAVDAAGNLYVADSVNKLVRLITPAGVVTTFATLTVAPTGVAVDPTKAGRIYVVTGTTITPVDNGTLGTPITDAAAFKSVAGASSGIAVDAAGNLWLADRGNHAIRKITSPLASPVTTTVAGLIGTSGKVNGALGTNLLNTPSGIGLDADGNVFFSEASNNSIRRLDTAGNVTVVVSNPNLLGTGVVPGSGGGLLPASVGAPQGLAINANGDLVVTTLDAVMLVTAPAGK